MTPLRLSLLLLLALFILFNLLKIIFIIIVIKFKNYCPISVGSVDVRYDSKNPAELYPSTTWELIVSGKYIQTGNLPLQSGGNNSIKIIKANLPAEKLQVESFSLTRGSMDITGGVNNSGQAGAFESPSGAFYGNSRSLPVLPTGKYYNLIKELQFKASRNWTGNTSPASPYTTAMGSGQAITVQPQYITLKFWKRLS